MTAVSSSIRIGGTAPPPETVCGRSATTPNERTPATRSFSRSGGGSAPSRTVGSEDTPARSQGHAPDGGSSGPGPDLGELEPALGEVLRQHLHVGEHRHEVRVAGPAGDDVEVDVVRHAGAGDPAQVPADVVALRRVGLRERSDPGTREPMELRNLLVVERDEVIRVP